MKCMIVLMFVVLFVSLHSQEYEWGYRFKVGDSFRYRTTKIVTQIKNERAYDDTLIVKVVNVDSKGNITLLFAEVKQKDTAELQRVGGTEALPVRYGFKFGTLLSGSEATIIMSRYGKLLKADFTKLSDEHRASRDSQLKDTSDSYRKSFINNEQGRLRHVLNYYFPILKEVDIISLNQTWSDSTISNASSTTSIDNGNKILNNHNVRKHLENTLNQILTINGTLCFKVNIKENRKDAGKHSFEMNTDEVFFLRVTDGALISATLDSNQQLDKEWFGNTAIEHTLIP